MSVPCAAVEVHKANNNCEWNKGRQREFYSRRQLFDDIARQIFATFPLNFSVLLCGLGNGGPAVGVAGTCCGAWRWSALGDVAVSCWSDGLFV